MSARALEIVEVLIEGQVYSIPRCEVVDGETLHPCGEEYVWCESCGLLGCEGCEGFQWVACLATPLYAILVCQGCVIPCQCLTCRSAGSVAPTASSKPPQPPSKAGS